MRNPRTLRVDPQTGFLVPDPTHHDRDNCARCQKGDRDHALWDWEKALKVSYYEDEPRYGAPFIMGALLGIFAGWLLFA
jgi:hypothetical protein